MERFLICYQLTALKDSIDDIYKTIDQISLIFKVTGRNGFSVPKIRITENLSTVLKEVKKIIKSLSYINL